MSCPRGVRAVLATICGVVVGLAACDQKAKDRKHLARVAGPALKAIEKHDKALLAHVKKSDADRETQGGDEEGSVRHAG